MLIRRAIEIEVEKHLSQREITLLVGPRQAGKTTLLRELESKLKTRGQKTAWLSLDWEQDRQYFASQKKLLQRIEYLIGKEGYVFIDEIQRKNDAGLFLKGIYDYHPKYKLVVSGSGSLELKEKIGESLAGRKRIFELSTLTLAELVSWKEGYKEEAQLLWKIYPEQLNEYIEEYRRFGGYPKVVLATTIDEKRLAIQEIYQSYLERDLIQLLSVEKSENLTHLVSILANQVGRLVNYSELANTLNLSIATVKKYLWYLEKTYIIYRVTPFARNKRKEITKSPVYYFADLGMQQYATGLFGGSGMLGMHSGDVDGFVAQNLVYLSLVEITRYLPGTIHYYRSRDGAEVDFVTLVGNQPIPWEVKDSDLPRQQVTRSLRSFIGAYQPRLGYVVCKSQLKDLTIGRTRVKFVSMGWLAQIYRMVDGANLFLK